MENKEKMFYQIGVGVTGACCYTLQKYKGIVVLNHVRTLFFNNQVKIRQKKVYAKSSEKIQVTVFTGRPETLSVVNYLKWRKIDYKLVQINPLKPDDYPDLGILGFLRLHSFRAFVSVRIS